MPQIEKCSPRVIPQLGRVLSMLGHLEVLTPLLTAPPKEGMGL